jgi:hypothetical protein
MMEHAVVTRGRRLKTKVGTYTRRYVWTWRLGRYLGRNEGTDVGSIARQGSIGRRVGT